MATSMTITFKQSVNVPIDVYKSCNGNDRAIYELVCKELQKTPSDEDFSKFTYSLQSDFESNLNSLFNSIPPEGISFVTMKDKKDLINQAIKLGRLRVEKGMIYHVY